MDRIYSYLSDIRTGRSPDENIYMKKIKIERDIGTGFLLDISRSTLTQIDDRKIIDIARESLIVMIEAMKTLNDHYGIYCFSSCGRFDNRFRVIKDFDEHFTDRVKKRIGKLAPERNTRMGPAIRHLITKLSTAQNRKKLMIIITDGKPWDYDYDYDYAREDTRKALYEARKKNINPFLVTVDRKGVDYFRAVFGRNNFVVLDSVTELPLKLPQIYKKLTL